MLALPIPLTAVAVSRRASWLFSTIDKRPVLPVGLSGPMPSTDVTFSTAGSAPITAATWS